MNRETLVSQAITAYLGYMENSGKLYWFRNNSFSGHVQRRDGSLGYIRNAKKGKPDIVCCVKGRFVGLEVKTATGRQSAEQKAAQAEIEGAGGLYYVVRDALEVKDIVDAI